MSRTRVVFAVPLLLVLALAACSPAAGDSSAPSTSLPPVPSAPSIAAPPPPLASPTPPMESPPVAAPTEGLADFTAAERYLLDGVLRGATECEPAAGSDDLPREALAGIECNSPDPSVARIGFYLFGDDQAMLEAYLFQMRAVGIELESGSCDDGGGEHSYAPGVDIIIERVGCFLDAEGRANYRALLPGVHVYIGIRGRSDDMRALEDFAWLGNQDTPGSPTLWGEPR